MNVKAVSSLTRLLVAALVAVTAAAFAQKPQVVTTVHPYFDLARQIGGELIDTTRLLPVGVSPHNFDPSPRDVMRVADADLIIRNGGIGLDEWVLRLITASGSNATQLSIMDEIEFTPLGTSAATGNAPAAEVTDLQSGDYFVNAHIWLDVSIAMSAAEAIRDALIGLDPDNAEAYTTNAAVLLVELEELDQWIAEELEPVRGEAFVPFHDAWPYFASRYGLNLVVEIEPFPGREPSPDYIVQALGLIRDSGARAIFGERQLSVRSAEVVAEEAGLPLYILDPEGGGLSGVESYQELLRFNTHVLLEALSP